MPHDLNGKELKVGDKVLIEATVEVIYEDDEYCNCQVRTTQPMPPYEEGDVITLNTRQVEFVETED